MADDLFEALSASHASASGAPEAVTLLNLAGHGAVITVSGSAIDSLALFSDEAPPVSVANATEILLQTTAVSGGVTYHPLVFELLGSGFTYDPLGGIIGGTVREVIFDSSPTPNGDGGFHLAIDGLVLPVGSLTGDTASLTEALFGGDDLWNGSIGSDVMAGDDGADTLVGLDGADSMDGGTGSDSVTAGPGNDLITDETGSNYLRGDEGDDSINGGSSFDDANGNTGADTIHGNGGDDYSVGGKDNDVLFGDAGNDIVWGNLGNDTCDGGDGADQVRGGQGDDSVSGGAGDDFVSGDRGNDTETGGAGADIFHGSQDAGIDKVLDFNLAEGDRVMLDPGTTYTVVQSGADTVIDMGGGNQMILVGVQMSSLTGDWIFLG